MKTKIVVGWNEYVDLPDWGIRRLGAKVDTGAQTSALHVENIEPVARGRIRFDVVVHREKRDRHFPVTARVTRRSRVRSSNGHYDVRYFVETTIRIGSVEKAIEVSLVDRGKMAHRMLLGRSALRGDFVVDVSRRHLLDPRRTKQVKKAKKVKKVKKVKTLKKLEQTKPVEKVGKRRAVERAPHKGSGS